MSCIYSTHLLGFWRAHEELIGVYTSDVGNVVEQRPTKRRRKALISIDTDDAGYTIRKIKAHRLMQIRTTLSRFLRYKNFSKKV